MYAGCESPGGPCEGSNSRFLKCEVSNACGMAGYDITVSCNCGAKRLTFAGAVPSFEQFTAQHRRAVAVRAFPLGISATLQQSMLPIAWSMLQDCSPPNCTGTPANALPLSMSTSIRDVSRIRITVGYCMNGSFTCQGYLGQLQGPIHTLSGHPE
jgi:hypothetical protein